MGGERMSRRLMLRNESGATPILPLEYQRCEWIENTGGSYISTSFIMPQYCTLKATFQRISSGAEGAVVGCRNSGFNNNYGYELGVVHSKKRAFSFAGASVSYIYTAEKPVLSVECNLTPTMQSSYFTEDGVSDAPQSATVTRNYYSNPVVLFRSYDKRNDQFHGRIYAIDVEDTSASKVLNLVPCYRKSDSVIGMYDIVSGTFYTNAGTGTFAKGDDV